MRRQLIDRTLNQLDIRARHQNRFRRFAIPRQFGLFFLGIEG